MSDLEDRLDITEHDADTLAAVVRDARATLSRQRGKSAAWDAMAAALNPEGMGLGDVLTRAEHRSRVRAARRQPNPRFGPVTT